MAFRFSTKVRNDMLGKKAECNVLYYGAAGIAFVDGGDGNDSITTTGASFITAGFEPGDMITVVGAINAGNNDSFVMLSVAAGTIEVPTGKLTTEAAGASAVVNLGSARGGSLVDQFRNGTMGIRTGSQPASADLAESRL